MMKSIYTALLLLLSTILVGQNAGEIAKFEEEIIALGKIVKGEKVKNQFVFTNITDSDIQIDLVSTCECTAAKWTSAPIAPGEKGKIDFTFDSNKKDEVMPIDVDVYFMNINPKTDNPYSIYLQYTFEYE